MRKLALVIALAPVLALAQAPSPAAPPPPPRGPAAGAPGGKGPGGPGPGADDPARLERVQKRMRLAATLGLAEALDLDEAGALKVRDAMARNGERRLPLQQKVRDDLRVLRDAARGDKAAAGQVDAALARLRDERHQLQALNDELLQQLTQGLSPEKKARAALFLGRFRERAQHMAMMRGDHHPGMMGPGRGPGRGMGPGPGRGMGPGWQGSADGFGAEPGAGPDRLAAVWSDGGEPELESWFADE